MKEYLKISIRVQKKSGLDIWVRLIKDGHIKVIKVWANNI